MQCIAEYQNGVSRYAYEYVEEALRKMDMDSDEMSHFAKSQLGKGFPFVSIRTTYDTKTDTIVCPSSTTFTLDY